jgi:hypothetical protein
MLYNLWLSVYMDILLYTLVIGLCGCCIANGSVVSILSYAKLLAQLLDTTDPLAIQQPHNPITSVYNNISM